MGGLSDLVRTGELHPCEYLMVESEFGALSAAIGASAAGARTYTATSSQGLLFMAEALYNASGLGLPIVRTSVAHGTAYDIAGKGVADATSLIEAARVAARLAMTKDEYRMTKE